MVIIVYGYDGSGPGHWQRWLYDELCRRDVAVAFPELPDPTWPNKDAWVAELAVLVDQASTPVTFACHSLGCWAVDHLLATRGAANVARALWVAPPSPHLIFEPVESFLPPPRQRSVWQPIASKSLLVGSDNDDFASAEELEEIAQGLGMPFHLLPGAGHVNVATGYGEWPFALDWLTSDA